MDRARENALAAAREKFFSGSAPADGAVPTEILRSWQRCAEQGLDAGDRLRIEPMTDGELRVLQQKNEALRLLSRPELISLRAEARHTDSVVILTDAAGTVLDVFGSPEFAGEAARVALRPGVAWSEPSTGTNAIGTALAERRAIAVHGPEHFFEPHGILHCAAAPIIDPYGKLAGVLDMSGHASAEHTHALGLVRLAVEQIEHRFFMRGFEDRTVLRFHKLAGMLGTAREGVLVFEGDRLVAANRRGLSLLGLDRRALRSARAPELFERLDADLRAQNGERFVASIVHPRGGLKAGRGPVRVPAPAAPAGLPYLTRAVRADLAKAIRLVDAEIPILIAGETGTGKEVFARQIAKGARRAGPFVAVNCAALPESLIEAELFGYEAGAFTGARQGGAKGLVQQAEGGILFLDEIGDMPLALQSRLLRVLQDKQVTPLGGGMPKTADFVPLCATNRDLKAMVEAGTFRADLYFRIAQFTIKLAPLAALPDRRQVVEALWAELDAGSGALPEPVLARLAGYDWPGNFRELHGVLCGLAALAEPGSPIAEADLPAHIGALPTPAAAPGTLGALAEDAMQAALDRHGGNVSAAARELGIDRSTLYRRLLWKGGTATSH